MGPSQKIVNEGKFFFFGSQKYQKLNTSQVLEITRLTLHWASSLVFHEPNLELLGHLEYCHLKHFLLFLQKTFLFWFFWRYQLFQGCAICQNAHAPWPKTNQNKNFENFTKLSSWKKVRKCCERRQLFVLIKKCNL